jgi:ketosteroid isomerase-like protein
MSANGDAVRRLHAGERGQLRRDALFDLLADDVEWHATGPLELFPWGGTHHGHDGVRRWFATLNDTMAYSKFELRELYEDGDTVVEVIVAAGEARATGEPFASEVVRIWSFRDGKAIRVRSYYDTYAYARALGTAGP